MKKYYSKIINFFQFPTLCIIILRYLDSLTFIYRKNKHNVGNHDEDDAVQV